jgi:RNA polymerase sigma-70 factor, ECF subfamily
MWRGRRLLEGTAVASATESMERQRVGDRGDRLPPRRTSDRRARAMPIDSDIGRLLAAEYRSLILYSRRLTSNAPDAADIVHIVCARVLSQQAAAVDVENMSGWLRTVLFHTFVDLRRRAQREIPTDSEALDCPAAMPEADAAAPRPSIDEVRALLSALPPHYRVPYELFTFEEMPYARIATVLGLSSTTVGTRINRARRRLRRLIRARYGA